MRAYVVKLSDIDLTRVRSIAAELRQEAEAELAPVRLGASAGERAPASEASAAGAVAADLFAQMCYLGQNFDMSVPLPEGEALKEEHLLDLADRFHHQHEAARGFSFPTQQPLVRGIRLVHRGRTPKPPVLARLGKVTRAADARTGSRPVHMGEGFSEVPTYDGASLGPGALVEGPALIEEPFTVVVLAASDVAVLDENGNYDIAIGGA
jgi:N-methylhydantoinase A